MKITFTTQHQSDVTGNELYRSGMQADLPHGERLVEMGVARAGWEREAVAVEESPPEEEGEWTVEGLIGVDLNQYTVAVLREICEAFGIPYAGLLKAQLIAAITAYIEANS